ncbi:MAG: Ig-like domain-containing protein [Planctomycetota bacterium]
MNLRAGLSVALGAAVGGALWVGCGGGGGGGGTPAAQTPNLGGMVFDYTDRAAQDVPVEVVGGPKGTTRRDGLLLLGPVPAGDRVLKVGDSVTTPTLFVPVSLGSQANFLERPVHLPLLTSGIGANLPAAVTTTTTVSGNGLPGVSLSLAGGSTVSLPGGTSNEVRVLGISPSRLPALLPGDRACKVAFLVEPQGVQFSPAATLKFPRLDPDTAGPFNLYRVEASTGTWQLAQSNLAPVDSGTAFEVPVNVGTMYAVAPATPPATVTLTGRVVVGTQPVQGYRVSCWNRVSAPTDQDGRFEVQNVPGDYSSFLVRAYPQRPAVDFAPGIETRTSATTALGDIVLPTATAPDGIRPRVTTTSPADGATGVNQASQVVVTFSEPIDTQLAEPVRLVGLNGQVPVRLNYDSAFQVRLLPNQTLDTSASYTIVVDSQVRDLAGNSIEDTTLTFGFMTRAGAPDAPPTDTLAFGLSPLSGVSGDTVSILGRNFTGGSQVTFGGFSSLVTSETSEQIQVQVPTAVPAGDVTLAVSAGGTAVGAQRPLVLDVRASVSTIYSGTTPETPLVFVDRDMPPATIVVDGANVGGAAVTVDGISIAAVDSTVNVGGTAVATGRAISLGSMAPDTLFTGPLVVRGANGQPSATYRFLLVRE